ncbi:MAG: LytTR family DNA-binding domain-containing protein [Eubacterium sp.]|nr:LytTR family DNA-binding domain-containing protein [Eubacterium sp.]
MYKIAICDDDANYISYMEEVIRRTGCEQHQIEFYEFTSGEEFVKEMKNLEFCNLLILDMQMEGMDGYATAQQFRKEYPDSVLVFCSGVVFPSDESFKTTPYRFLQKSYDDDKMLIEVKAVIEKMIQSSDVPYIVGRNHNNVVKLRPNHILYIENCKRGSEIHIREDYKDYAFEDKITTHMKLAELLETLKDYGFVYAHNSYIVNLKYVVKLKSDGVLKLINGCELNVSRSRMPEFRKALAHLLGDKYN